METGVARVTKVIENDDSHHEKSISHRENVEWGPTEVLGPHVEVKISLCESKVNFEGSLIQTPAALSCDGA